MSYIRTYINNFEDWLLETAAQRGLELYTAAEEAAQKAVTKRKRKKKKKKKRGNVGTKSLQTASPSQVSRSRILRV